MNIKTTVPFLLFIIIIYACSNNSNNSNINISNDSINDDTILNDTLNTITKKTPEKDPYQSSMDSIAIGIIPKWIKNATAALINLEELHYKNFTGVMEVPSDSLFDFPYNPNKKFKFLHGIQLYNYFPPVFKGDSNLYKVELDEFQAMQYAYSIGYIKPINNFTPVIVGRAVKAMFDIYLISLDNKNKKTDELVAASDNCRLDIIVSGTVKKTFVNANNITQVDYKIQILNKNDQNGPLHIDSIASTITINKSGKFIKQKLGQKRFRLKNQEEARTFFEAH